MSVIRSPWIKLTETIYSNDFPLIHALQDICIREDQTALKLELDYKLGWAATQENTERLNNINEFMFFDGALLIGYIGIGSFGGTEVLEVNGMVHPEYRRQGVFTQLYALAESEWKRRNTGKMLLLCDRNSCSGQAFIQSTGARYMNSEYEMYLNMDSFKKVKRQACGITFRKATNSDAHEITRQNRIYFGAETGPLEGDAGDSIKLILPEAEEQRGMTIFLAEKEQEVIGKVHLQFIADCGAIYGLGVLPEHRGKGWGRAILIKAIEKLTEMKAKEVMLQVAAENSKALKLYESCGFTAASTMDYYQKCLPRHT